MLKLENPSSSDDLVSQAPGSWIQAHGLESDSGDAKATTRDEWL